MKILVLGGAGMLGHKMFQVLREHYSDTICTVKRDTIEAPINRIPLLQGNDVIPNVDVTNFELLRGLLKAIRPDFIVNCVGVVKQREESLMAVPSITINSLLPHQLATMAEEWGGKVIHPSTDCIFDGRKGSYTLDDLSNAEDLYGKSKFLGELRRENAITLRTSIIGRELYGHRSLLDWFLRQRGRSVRGYRRVIYSGVTTNELADVVATLIGKFPGIHGLYQVASEPISKFDLLCLIRQAYGMDIEIIPDDIEVSDRSMMGDRFMETTGYSTPSWPELVARLAADVTPYGEWLKPAA